MINQTNTQRVQAAASSGAAPPDSIVQIRSPLAPADYQRMEFLGGAAAQDKAIGNLLL